MTNFTFSIDTARRDIERRKRFICAYYGVSTFWATDMWMDEIEWFETKIFEKEGAD